MTDRYANPAGSICGHRLGCPSSPNEPTVESARADNPVVGSPACAALGPARWSLMFRPFHRAPSSGLAASRPGTRWTLEEASEARLRPRVGAHEEPCSHATFTTQPPLRGSRRRPREQPVGLCVTWPQVSLSSRLSLGQAAFRHIVFRGKPPQREIRALSSAIFDLPRQRRGDTLPAAAIGSWRFRESTFQQPPVSFLGPHLSLVPDYSRPRGVAFRADRSWP